MEIDEVVDVDVEMMKSLSEKISKLLEAKRFTNDRERHGLKFMEMELSATVASLTKPLHPSSHDVGSHEMLQFCGKYIKDTVKYICKNREGTRHALAVL
uniref:Uncharacterized protein n=1 Tax=Leersia perrieri TaxID=77586 RepID=A0A0D9XTZ7_9ORYZ